MTSLFEELCEGLNEAIDFAKDKGPAKTRTFVITPVKVFGKDDIKRIRNNAGMTQNVLASYMGVSKKTVEAWESGRTHPTGPACRLLDILDGGLEDGLKFITTIQK